MSRSLILALSLFLASCGASPGAGPGDPTLPGPSASPSTSPTVSPTANPSATPSSNPDTQSPLQNTRWVYQGLLSDGVNTDVIAESHVTLNFSDTRASGDSGCNAYAGDYNVNGNQLSFNTLISTKKACLDDAITQQEQDFLGHLSKVAQYSINQDTLTLTDSEGAQLRFQQLEAKTLFVDSQLATCSGVGLRQCMRVRSDANADWTLFYDAIEGFDYEAGYNYELLVTETPVANPPADGSSIKTTLVEVIKKEAVATASVANTEWVYQSQRASNGELTAVLPETELTLNFGDSQASGNAGCNLFSGDYTQNGSALSFSTLISTERACLDAEATQQEQDFLSHLGQVAQVSLNQDLLILTDSNGTQLNFKAKN